MNSAFTSWPPSDVSSTEKVASPCKLAARVFTGSTVNLQLLAPEPRVTVIFLASTPVASPHEMS